MTFELAKQAAVDSRRKPSPFFNSAHLSFQPHREHSGKMILPTLSDSKVCNKEHEPPVPGTAGVAIFYTGNAQIHFPLCAG